MILHPQLRILVIALIFIIGLLVRIFLASTLHGNYDQSSYEVVAEIMEHDGNVYQETYRYNYSPIWMNILHRLDQLAKTTHNTFPYMVRSFLTTVDLITALIIVGIVTNFAPGQGILTFSAYWLNPGMWALIGFHGQFEVLALLPVLILIWLHVKRSRPPHFVIVLLLSSLALVIKHNVVFVLWAVLVYFCGWKKAFGVICIGVLVLLGTLLPYVLTGGAEGVVIHVLLYPSQQGNYGFSFPVEILYSGTTRTLLEKINLLVMIGATLFTPIWLTRNPFPLRLSYVLTLTLVVWFVTISGFGIQYMALIFVAGMLDRRNYPWLLQIGVLTLLWEAGYILPLPQTFFGFIMWIIFIVWFAYLIIKRRSFYEKVDVGAVVQDHLTHLLKV